MPDVAEPWRVRTNAPDHVAAFGTNRGEIFVTAGNWLAGDYNWVWLTKDLPAPENATSVNVRLEQPLMLIEAYASAFALLGYEYASVRLSLTASEGAASAHSTALVVQAASAVISVGHEDLSQRPWDFPDNQQPLTFVRPSAAPGSVTVGVLVQCNAYGGGLFAAGAGCRLHTTLQGMTVEWMWPA